MKPRADQNLVDEVTQQMQAEEGRSGTEVSSTESENDFRSLYTQDRDEAEEAVNSDPEDPKEARRVAEEVNEAMKHLGVTTAFEFVYSFENYKEVYKAYGKGVANNWTRAKLEFEPRIMTRTKLERLHRVQISHKVIDEVRAEADGEVAKVKGGNFDEISPETRKLNVMIAKKRKLEESVVKIVKHAEKQTTGDVQQDVSSNERSCKQVGNH